MRPLSIPGPDNSAKAEAAARLQRRLFLAWMRQVENGRRGRIELGAVDAVLIACLGLCLLAIGLGIDRMYPVLRPSVGHAIAEDLPVRPFPDCEDAHAAGVSNIPRGSPAYAPEQDGNNNGLACEPN